MKKYLPLVLLFCVAPLWAQRMTTQTFYARKITYSPQEPIVPVNGVNISINNATFRSDINGNVTANIAIMQDNSFHIATISAPDYMVVQPNNLEQPFFLSKNPILVIVADPKLVQQERERIIRNNQIALAEMESKLSKEQKQNASYKREKAQLEVRIDSLAQCLSTMDVQSLSTNDQQRIEKEKNGEWLDIIVDRVLEQLDQHVDKKRVTQRNKFIHELQQQSDWFYQNFFSHITITSKYILEYWEELYTDFIDDYVSKQHKQYKLALLNTDEVSELTRNHISTTWKQWETSINSQQQPASSIDNPNKDEYQVDLNKFINKFIDDVIYGDSRRGHEQQFKGVYWRNSVEIIDLSVIFKSVDSVYYNRIYTIFATNYQSLQQKYKEDSTFMVTEQQFSQDVSNILYGSQGLYAQTDNIPSKMSQPLKNKCFEAIQSSFVLDIINVHNDLVLCKEYEYNKGWKPSSVMNGIPNPEQELETMIYWNYTCNADSTDFIKLQSKDPEFYEYINPALSELCEPFWSRYNVQTTTFSTINSIRDIYYAYCIEPIRSKLYSIIDIPAFTLYSNEKRKLILSILEINFCQMVQQHNQELANIQQRHKEAEAKRIKELSSHNIESFSSEGDVLDFLKTHRYEIEDFEYSEWFDFNLTEQRMSTGGYLPLDTIEVITFTKKIAKVRIRLAQSNIPIIGVINLQGEIPTFTESHLNESREYIIKKIEF